MSSPRPGVAAAAQTAAGKNSRGDCQALLKVNLKLIIERVIIERVNLKVKETDLAESWVYRMVFLIFSAKKKSVYSFFNNTGN